MLTSQRKKLLLDRLAAEGQLVAKALALDLDTSEATIRSDLRAFAAEGLACLRQKSTRPKTIYATWPKERDADLRALLADIGQLPEDQRSALVLAELADMPHTEIGAVIGVPASKVKALVHQARTHLIAERDATLDARARKLLQKRGRLSARVEVQIGRKRSGRAVTLVQDRV